MPATNEFFGYVDEENIEASLDMSSIFAVAGPAVLIPGPQGEKGADGRDGKSPDPIDPIQLNNALFSLGLPTITEVNSKIALSINNALINNRITASELEGMLDGLGYSTQSEIIALINTLLENYDFGDGGGGSGSIADYEFSEISEKTIQEYRNIDGSNVGISESIDPTLFGGRYIGKKFKTTGKHALSIFSSIDAEIQQGLHSVGGYQHTVALYGGQITDEKNLNTGQFFEIGILGTDDIRLADAGSSSTPKRMTGKNFFGVPTHIMKGGDLYIELKGLFQISKNLLILTQDGNMILPKGRLFDKDNMGLI